MTISLFTRLSTSVALLITSLASAGCAVNPATGEQSFTAFMSPAEEIRVGQEQHPKILKEFGGVYQKPDLARYVGKKWMHQM